MFRILGCALLLLLTQKLFGVHAYCTEVVSSNTSVYSTTMESYYDCEIKILANSTHSIKLTTTETIVNVKQNFHLADELVNVNHGNVNTGEFVVQPNTGLIINKANHGYPYPTFKVERFVEVHSACGEVNQTVGKLQIVQSSFVESVSRSCFYHLTPEISNNQTLFVFFESVPGNSEVMIRHTERVPIDNKFLMIPNWSSVNVLSKLISEKPSKLATIRAASVENTCTCGPRNYTLSHDPIVFRTPSLPDFACPDISCVTEIHPLSENEVEDYIPRILVSINVVGQSDIDFHFKTADKFFAMKGLAPCQFLLDTHQTAISYKTPSAYFKGFVETSLSKVMIHVDCECSTLFEKAYNREYSLRIVIPASCELMFCHWSVNIQHAHQKDVGYIIEVSLRNAGTNDTIHVFGNEMLETYNEEELKWPRIVHVTKSNEANIAFWRKKTGPEAILELRWRVLGIVHTEPEKSIPLTTDPITVVSPFFPANHNNFLNLTYKFFAPRNHKILMHIDEVDVEKIHDHFAVYEGVPGNSTELAYLTGQHKNITLNSTGDILFIKFVSDAYASGRGFHVNVVAVPVIQSTETIPTVSETLLEKSSSSSHPIIIVFVVFLIIAIALGLFMMREKIVKCGKTRNFNPMVRFRSQDDGQLVNISL